MLKKNVIMGTVLASVLYLSFRGTVLVIELLRSPPAPAPASSLLRTAISMQNIYDGTILWLNFATAVLFCAFAFAFYLFGVSKGWIESAWASRLVALLRRAARPDETTGEEPGHPLGEDRA